MGCSTGVIHSSTQTETLAPCEWKQALKSLWTGLQVISTLTWKWCHPSRYQQRPNRRRQDVCERGSSSLCLWVCTHTWAKLRRGDLTRLYFSFYLITLPSSSSSSLLHSPSPLPLLPSLAFLAQSVSSIHLSLSRSEVNAGSLQCRERVQHQEHVSHYWLTACELTNGKKRGTAVMGPLHDQ